MVNAQARKAPLLCKLKDELVRFAKDLPVFYPQRDQVIDGKEATVVDLFSTYLPEGKAEVLPCQETVQQVKA